MSYINDGHFEAEKNCSIDSSQEEEDDWSYANAGYLKINNASAHNSNIQSKKGQIIEAYNYEEDADFNFQASGAQENIHINFTSTQMGVWFKINNVPQPKAKRCKRGPESPDLQAEIYGEGIPLRSILTTKQRNF